MLMSHMMKTLGQNVARIRIEKGLNKGDLSVRLGISESELINIENGTADVETEFVDTVMETLEVGLDDLFCSDTSRNHLLKQIENKLDTCSEKDLILVFECITGVVNKNPPA